MNKNFIIKVPLGNKIFLILSILALSIIVITGRQKQVLEGHASGLNSARLQASSASLAGPAVIIADSTASNGKALEFTSTLLSTPMPTIPLFTPTPTSSQQNGKVGWSSAFYVGWQQNSYPPNTIPWKDITHLMQFSIVTSTKRDGSIDYGNLTTAEMQAAVPVAHQHNVKILISIGGADDTNWDAACNATNRTKFINNLVGIMKPTFAVEIHQ